MSLEDLLKEKIIENYPRLKYKVSLTEGMKQLITNDKLKFASWYLCFSFYLEMYYAGFVQEEYLNYYGNRLAIIQVTLISNYEQEEYKKALKFLSMLKNKEIETESHNKITITPYHRK